MDDNTDIPNVLSVRDLRAKHIGKKVSIKGIVHALDMIKPKLLKAAFVCEYCETEVATDSLEDPAVCENETCGRSDGLVFLEDKAVYTDYLQMTLAYIFELGDSSKKYSIQVDLEGDLVNGIKEKDVVIVKGILQTTAGKHCKIPKNIDYTLTAKSVEVLDKSEPSKMHTANKDAGESSQRKDSKKIKEVIKSVGEKHPGGKAPLNEVYVEAKIQHQFDTKRTGDLIERMRRCGDLIKPDKEHVKVI